MPRPSFFSFTNKTIATDIVLVGGLVLVAKGIMALREVVLAWAYGVSGLVDAYQLAITIVTWFPMVVWSLGISVFVPRLVAAKTDDRDTLISEMSLFFILISVLTTLAIALLTPQIVAHLAPGSSGETRSTATHLSWGLTPFIPLFLMASMYAIRLQARQRYWYTLWEAAPAAGLIILVVLAPPAAFLGPIVAGTLAGAILQALILRKMAHNTESGVRPIARRFRPEVWRPLLMSIAIMGGGQIVISLSTPIDQYFASFHGEGALSSFGYASRLLNLGTTLGMVVIGRVLLPTFAKLVNDNALSEGRRQVIKWTAFMFGVGTAAAVIAAFAALPIVTLLFERGAFSAEASEAVARLVRYGALQLPVFSAGIVLVQWFAARRRYDVLLYATLAGLLVKIVTNIVFTATWGLAGVMASSAAMYLSTGAVMMLYLARERFAENGQAV